MKSKGRQAKSGLVGAAGKQASEGRRGKDAAPGPQIWPYLAALAAAVIAAFVAYGPALHGPFLFDDNFLPFATGDLGSIPLIAWVRGVRPVLMASYWMNARLSGDDPWSYHVVNILIHLAASGLVFVMLRRVMELAHVEKPRIELLAALGAGLFLLHPVQTEAVAYLAGRSESLSVMLVFAAFTLFLYRAQPAASWTAVAGILALFGAAALAKEHTVALAPLLLVTDYWWNPGFTFAGIRRNWKLYAPMAVGALAAVAFAWQLLTRANSAGFALKEFTWYQYFFTQCRALFVYPGEFLLPVQLTADWDFPISRTIFDHGAIVGLAVLVALLVLAWIWRKRYPLAAYGFVMYLILMAPTSSIIPIQDAVAERRLYFAFPGLLLILLEVLTRVRIPARTLAMAGAAILAVLAGATWARAHVWADPLALWQDNVRKSPNKARGHFNLAFAYYSQGRLDLALPEFEKTAQLGPATQSLLVDWGLALDGVGRQDEALAKIKQAVLLPPDLGLSPANVYTQLAKLYAERSQWPEALEALATAERADPRYPETYSYRGKVFFKTGQMQAAVEQFQKALLLDPNSQDAGHDLALARASQRSGR